MKNQWHRIQLQNKLKTLYACTITGPQTERNILSLGRNHLMIKIGFQPGALHRLLRVPMQQMIQIDYDGEAVFGSTVKDVVDAFANTADFNTMINIANEFMFSHLAKIKKPFSIDYVIPEIIKYGGTIKIDELVKKAYMGNRQFERAFKDRMGVSPQILQQTG